MTEYLPTQIRALKVEVVAPLQMILQKTTERLCEAVAIEWNCEELLNVKLHGTCGFASFSGNLNPHQNYHDASEENTSAQQSQLVTSLSRAHYFSARFLCLRPAACSLNPQSSPSRSASSLSTLSACSRSRVSRDATGFVCATHGFAERLSTREAPVRGCIRPFWRKIR